MVQDAVTLRRQINDIFKSSGLLSKKLSGFHYRRSQKEMALLVSEAIASMGNIAVVEAATGIGKSIAYLVPVFLYNKRTIISTANLYLQDQLINKDIPFVADLLDSKAQVSVLKGRRNYLCLLKLKLYGNDMLSENDGFIKSLKEWSQVTTTGELSEIKMLAGNKEIAKFTVGSEDCLGKKCEEYDNCFAYKQRAKAAKADIVIVNHDVLLQDLLLKEKNQVGLLSSADCYIVDEAHQLHDKAVSAFGSDISSKELKRIYEDTARWVLTNSDVRLARTALLNSSEAIFNRLEKMNMAVLNYDKLQDTLFQNTSSDSSEGSIWNALKVSIHSLQQALAQMPNANESIAGPLYALDALYEKIDGYFDNDKNIARYARVGKSEFHLLSAPLSVAHEYQYRIKEHLPEASWIYTSATLSVGGNFDSFRRQMGYSHDVIEGIYPSPFSLKKCAVIYIDKDLPHPQHHRRAFIREYIKLSAQLIQENNGSTLMLFSSNENLQEGYRLLETELRHCDPPFLLLRQKSAAAKHLVQQFISQPRAVLLGMKQFTEGLDIVGRNLSLVMIDKVPFASPADPLYQQRIEWFKNNERDPFTQLQIPDAVLALKQAVGRLIRSEGDHGVICFGDSRLADKGWGKLVIKEFDAYRRAKTIESVITFIKKHQATE